MFDIKYFSPKTLEEALDYLAANQGVRILAGGTDLIARWKKTGWYDMSVLDVSKIEGFGIIKEENGKLFIGAGAKMVEIMYSEVIQKNFPILAESASKVGSVQIRNMATIGGNSCNAAPSADTVLPLIVYGAEAVIVAKSTEKRCPIEKFFVAPGKTILQPGELLKGFYVPFQKAGCKAAFAKHSRRAGMDLATVGAAVRYVLDGGKVSDVRIALGAVAPVPVCVKDLEQFDGAEFNAATIEAITKVAAPQAKPITDVRGSQWYRNDMVEHNVRDCLERAQ